MCWTCHQGLSDENIENQLSEIIRNPEFNIWNDCALNHFLIVGTGYNGKSNQIKANKLLDMYRWHLFKSGNLFKWLRIKYLQLTFKVPEVSAV
jgi:hypothetical protein